MSDINSNESMKKQLQKPPLLYKSAVFNKILYKYEKKSIQARKFCNKKAQYIQQEYLSE